MRILVTDMTTYVCQSKPSTLSNYGISEEVVRNTTIFETRVCKNSDTIKFITPYQSINTYQGSRMRDRYRKENEGDRKFDFLSRSIDEQKLHRSALKDSLKICGDKGRN